MLWRNWFLPKRKLRVPVEKLEGGANLGWGRAEEKEKKEYYIHGARKCKVPFGIIG